MTDLPNDRRRSDKRERLVASAADVMHRHGLEGLTLARVAEDAGVPIGNVYYYFKTRDDLIGAVVDERLSQVTRLLAALELRPTPRGRLKALARSWAENAELVVGHGCPIGSMAAELARHDDASRECGERPLRQVIDWAEAQFRELDARHARARAITYVAAIQGAALLANAFHDPQLLHREVRRIEKDLDGPA